MIISHFPQGGGGNGGGQKISPTRNVSGKAAEAIIPGDAVYTTYDFDVVKSTLGFGRIKCIDRLNNLVVVGGENRNGVSLYTISSDGTLTYKNDVLETRETIYAAKFYTVESQDSTTEATFLIIGGAGICKVFSVAVNGAIQFVQNIATEFSVVSSIAVGPYINGTSIVLGGRGNLVEIWVASWSSGAAIQKRSRIPVVDGDLLGCMVNLDLSPDGGTLAVGWRAYLHGTIALVGGTSLWNMASLPSHWMPKPIAPAGRVTFAPNGSYLVVGEADKAEVYLKQSGGGYTYSHDIPADAVGGSFDTYVLKVVWSPDGTKALIIGAFDCCAKLYSVGAGGRFTFLMNLLDKGGGKLSESVSAALYQDGAITLGGDIEQSSARYTLKNGLPKVQTMIHKATDMTMPYGIVSDIGYADTAIHAQTEGAFQCIASTGGI